MADPFAKALADAIAERFTNQCALIEEWCERSLVDPEGRGVLIEWHDYPTAFAIGLSTDVPWGTIKEIR